MNEEKTCKNFVNCCRTCLNEPSSGTINIFENRKDTMNVAEMLFTCTGLTVGSLDLYYYCSKRSVLYYK